MRRGLLLVAALAGALAACSSDKTGTTPSAEETDGGTNETEGGAAVACSDGAIADVLAAEERSYVDLAMAVRGRLQSPDAIAFAEKEITDHTLLFLQLQGAARADAITFVADDDADAVTQVTQLSVLSLQGTSGPALDRAYVARVILAHLQDAAMLEGLLAPAARDTRIVDDIQRRRPQLAEHQALAQSLQQKLGGSCGP